MTEFRSLDDRFAGFVKAYESGDGNPLPFMDGLDEPDRRRFRLKIDRYLEENPDPVVNLKRLKDPKLRAMASKMAARLDSASGAMPQLVISLRETEGLLQADVVEALAGELNATPPEKEKIDDYYHDLEYGNLPAKGISAKLLASLAKILGTTTEALRDAGQALGPSGSPAKGLIYTRMADDAEDSLGGTTSFADAPSGATGSLTDALSGAGRQSEPQDRIDRLFTGG